MSGYTPVFGSMFNGSLCGRWPALAVWATLLPLADRHGHIDMTPEAICALSGWPLDLLKAGISQLCEPDPRSRTKTDDGRRLAPLDPDRDWGWQIVNHSTYREKARKMMQQIEATESGRDAERKRIERERHKAAMNQRPAMSSAVPSRPDMSRAVPRSPALTGSQTQTQTQTHEEKPPASRPPSGSRARRCPPAWTVSQELKAWADREVPAVDLERELAKMRDHEFAEPRSDWDAVARNWLRRAAETAGTKRVTPLVLHEAPAGVDIWALEGKR